MYNLYNYVFLLTGNISALKVFDRSSQNSKNSSLIIECRGYIFFQTVTDLFVFFYSPHYINAFCM